MLIHPGKSLFEQNPFALATLLILFFAENEPEESKIGIAWCIKNRMSYQKNKDDIMLALFSLGISTVSDNGICKKSVLCTFSQELWDKTFILCKSILDGTSEYKDITYGSDIFFLTKEKLPHWIKENFFKVQYGNIRFYRIESPKKK